MDYSYTNHSVPVDVNGSSVVVTNGSEMVVADSQQQQSGAALKLAVAMICVAIACVGFFCNALTLVILKKDSDAKKKSAMAFILAALAVTDCVCLMLVFCLVQDDIALSLVKLKHLDESSLYYTAAVSMSQVINRALWCPCYMVEVWLILTVTVDRFVAVCYPLQHQRLFTWRKAIVIVCVIFLAAFLTTLLASLNDLAVIELTEVHKRATDVIIYIGLVLPVVFLSAFNIALLVELHKAHVRHSRLTGGRKQSADSAGVSNTATAHIVAVVIAFLVCQLPYWFRVLCRILYNHGHTSVLHIAQSPDLANLMIIMLDVNFSINFFLYCLFYRRFRAVAKRILPCWPSSTRRGGYIDVMTMNSIQSTQFTDAD